MKILQQLFIIAFALTILISCGTAKTTTQNIPATPKAPETPTIIVDTPKMLAKKDIMKEAEINTWPHADIYKDSIPGLSLDQAYNFIKTKHGEAVIVGVIDSGIDVEHEDLKDVIWVNKGEIAGNGKDDDNNGYIDDINGWNFLGGNGKSNPEQLELTRIVKKWTPRFEGKSADGIKEDDKADFDLYVKLKKIVDDKNASAKNQVTQYKTIRDFIVKANDTIQKSLGKKEYLLQDTNAILLADPALMQGKIIIMRILDSGETVDAALEELSGIVDHYSNQLNAQYKLDFNGRITGDNPDDINDKNYGNGNVMGSKDDESHGTHVAGIIAAKRNNNIGMNGVAHNVQLMAIRAVPDGDEYDKDIALAIRYAVDNGAKVVNMSFGKSYSPNAEWVYDAIKYAAEKDVLLIHAAGNSGEDLDTENNFPNDSKDKLTEFSNNVITVGAISRFYNEKLAATFSNYGKKNVDIFAPGVDIYSTIPKDSYGPNNGTSMAAPEVAGVAALIRSYYPTLTANQVKHILMDSGIEYNGKVILPGSETEKVDFKSLSVSGKVLNAYNALKLAEKMTKK